MNANELADALDKAAEYLSIIGDADFRQAATMLRQQQAEIEALKDSSYEKGFIDGMAKMTESAVHCAVKGMALKELTDEEILIEAKYQPNLGYYLACEYDVLDFARAILRKAQDERK